MIREQIRGLDNVNFRLQNYEDYVKQDPPYWKRVDWQAQKLRRWKEFSSRFVRNEMQPGLSFADHEEFVQSLSAQIYANRYGLDMYYKNEVYALYNQGFYIKVAKDVCVQAPLIIDYDMDANNDHLLDFNIIELEEGASLSVIINYRSKDQEAHYRNSVLKVIAKANSELKLCRVQNLNLQSKSHDFSDFDIASDAQVNYFSVEMGGKINAVSSTAYLKGYRAGIHMMPAYLADQKRKCDLAYSVIFQGKNCQGYINGNGAVFGGAKKVFRGNIYFERGSARSVGREGSFDILLDQDLRAHSIPTLFCDEDDVIGEHYASVGKIDEKKLMYLMSRGISEAQAKKIVVESSFRPIFDCIDDEAIKQELYAQLEQRIS